LSERVLLISDLHLEEHRPDITAAFKSFLQANQSSCTSLYILGDLFEVWIGDDAQSPLAQEIAVALAEFNKVGSDVFLMHGNRDFLIGESYAQQCGASLISEPHELIVGNLKALLLHGDALCTDDVDYQAFRAMVRDESWQTEFLAKTVEERIAYAREARRQSQQATGQKSTEIMDVNADAVQRQFDESQHTILIHGHTHRPAIHKESLDSDQNCGVERKRIVLGDWEQQLWYVEIQQGELELRSMPL